ncbi:MAG: radical SAM protein [Alphaproteobacteria bacterium]|nr:radical SAM protein [Rhodospirillaceae bacterium]MBT7615014.1 radical SAM protein [Rhodospirillaceae bacterium]MDG2479449.1 radical SAM protein [Alphaproteobacteria bacterium]
MLTIRTDGKFVDPNITAKGEQRAYVDLKQLSTLWINTGTLCNLTCAACYIESSPRNDRLVYITAAEVAAYLDEIERDGLGTEEIGFTGGEPFVNPDFMTMAEDALVRGFRVMILTNAMRPMMKCADGLLDLQVRYPERLTLRVSVDHYTKLRHQMERGARSWDPMIKGLRWLAEHRFTVHLAGRTYWNEDAAKLREGYRAFIADLGLKVDAEDPLQMVLFPEMDEKAEVPEITTACWDILDVDPAGVMCASSRMVVKRKGADKPAVIACTLLPYDTQFEMGETLAQAAGAVKLNHPHCAKFCVLGGGSCSKG